MSTDTPHYETSLETGKHWSLRLRRGLVLGLSTDSPHANVGLIMYNAHNFLERYNAPDTLKCQHTFHLTQGHCLYSDMGHIMASVILDTSGGHESSCGNLDATGVAERYGRRDYQNDRNAWRQNGQDSFLVELAKYGLTRRDLPANLNLFNRCQIGEDGQISLDQTHKRGLRRVGLRIEMDCLVMMHTCPHPLLETENYPESSINIALRDAAPMTDDDECLTHCPENRRGFQNNYLYHLGMNPAIHAASAS